MGDSKKSDKSRSENVDLSHHWPGSDVVFLVEQKKIYANKGVLGLSSPVFNAMLFSDFKEKTSESIPLPGKKYNDVLLLFMICHTLSNDGSSFLTDDNIAILLPLTREYQVNRVVKLCEQHLLSRPPTVRNLILAREYGLESLEEKCMNHAKKTPLSQLKQEEGFVDLITDPCAQFLMTKVEELEQDLNKLRSTAHTCNCRNVAVPYANYEYHEQYIH